MATLEINGRRVEVDDSFRSLSPEDQAATVEEIAASMGIEKSNEGIMPQLNEGIRQSAGGIVDLINPFDQPHALNPFPEGTGSAKEGIGAGMDAVGVNTATGDPRNMLESAARSAGQAAGTAPFFGVGAQALSRAPGLLGAVSGDVGRSLNTGRGVASEFLAGGGAGAAEDAAETAGAPEWAQTAAGIAGGVGVGALPFVAGKTPTALGGRAIGRAVKTAAMPYTKDGAQEVARQRVQELAGGPERSERLANELANGTELGLTPAQITGDQNLLGLEQQAARQNPELRERLAARLEQSTRSVDRAMPEPDGSVAITQDFFDQRRETARSAIQSTINDATNNVLRPTARNSEILNSEAVRQQLDNAYGVSKAQETQLWESVPRGVTVGTDNAKQRMAQVLQDTPGAQENDIPGVARQFLEDGGNRQFGDFESVKEMHGLYSELRRIAREAGAGPSPNNDRKRIANDLAESILEDFGGGVGEGEAGRAISNALAFTREHHEVFSQGTVGRLLRKTANTDEQIDPRLALERTLGRGGATGSVAADDITRAADTDATQTAMEDFLRSRFDRAAFDSEGQFKGRNALQFLRENKDTLDRMPELRDTFVEAVRTQSRAGSAQTRGGRVLSDMDNPRKSGTAAFTQAAPENAVDDVFKAKRPSFEARKLAATARKDTSGDTGSGLKRAFSDYLIRQSTDSNGLSSDKMRTFLQSPEKRAALAQVYDPPELRRLDIIAAEVGKLQKARKPAPDVGDLSNAAPNRLIDMAARIMAARQGAKAGGGSGGSIQTAQMASSQMKKTLGRLQNDKAAQMLMDAVEDPELMRTLLMDTGKIQLNRNQINRLAPYFAGAVAGTQDTDDPAREKRQPLRLELNDPGNQNRRTAP